MPLAVLERLKKYFAVARSALWTVRSWPSAP
jgi:hypothetical protein